MKIFDNVVKRENADKLEELFLSNLFPWYLVKRSSGIADSQTGYTDTFQMEHNFISHGNIQSVVLHQVMSLLGWENIIKKFNLNPEILRMKSNLLFNTKTTPNTPHIDLPQPHTVLLYYVNNSTGPTILYEKNKKKFIETEKIEPKKGRFILFDGGTFHSSTPPIDNEYRCVINFNLKLDI